MRRKEQLEYIQRQDNKIRQKKIILIRAVNKVNRRKGTQGAKLKTANLEERL